MIKINKINLFLIVLGICAITFYFSNRDYPKIDDKREFITFFKINQSCFINFAANMEAGSLSDSNFYAEHRFKENKFYFFHLNGHVISDNFELTPKMQRDFNKSVAALDIKAVWKYPDENFYSITVRGFLKFEDKNVYVLILKKKQNEFLFPENSDWKIMDTTSSIGVINSKKSIFMINERVWLKFDN
ncbi:MAG TPA: hypothetical protein VF939_20650 [Puia sp.]